MLHLLWPCTHPIIFLFTSLSWANTYRNEISLEDYGSRQTSYIRMARHCYMPMNDSFKQCIAVTNYFRNRILEIKAG